MRGVNLIPAPRLQAQRRMTRLCRWGAACGVYGAVIVCAAAVGQMTSSQGHVALEAQAAELHRQTQEDLEAVKRIRPELAATTAALQVAQRVGEQPDWSLLLALVADRLGDDAVLSSCRIHPAPKGYRLSLTGLARSHAAVLGCIQSLEATGICASVTLLETHQEPFGTGEAVVFAMEAMLLRSGPQEEAP